MTSEAAMNRCPRQHFLQASHRFFFLFIDLEVCETDHTHKQQSWAGIRDKISCRHRTSTTKSAIAFPSCRAYLVNIPP